MSGDIYRFLLIDDEDIIRDGISSGIDWEAECFDFLEPASDGLEAIDRIKKYSPDVILTDICMPGKDGIEIAEWVSKNSPETLVVMLSGYDDFEYAQSALRYNVFDYILKPISSRSLRKLLEKIRGELKRRSEFRLDYERLLLQVEKSREAILARFLYKLVTGGASGESLAEYSGYLPFNAGHNRFCVMVIEPEASGAVETRISLDMCLVAVEESLKDSGTEATSIAVFQSPDSRVVMIAGSSNRRTCMVDSTEIAGKAHDSLSSIPGYTFSVGVGTVKESLFDVGTSYLEALSALEYRLIAGADDVFLYRRRCRNVMEHDIRFRVFPDMMKDALRTQPLSRSIDIIVDFCSALKKSEQPVKRIRFELSKFVFGIIEVLDDIDLQDEAEKLVKTIDLPDLNEIEAALIDSVTSVSMRMKEQRRKFPEKKVLEIQQYLEENFTDPGITAEGVSLKFFISQSYLSRLFKHHSGKTFIEYLTSLRMGRACELLKNTDKRTFEIAEEVGYRDSGYFSSCFKKAVGVSPSRYREKL